MVVRRGVNQGQIIPMARRFRDQRFILRFIEYMDVGNCNGWRMDEVVSSREIVELLQDEFPLEPLAANYGGEVARRYRHLGGGEIGIIASVSQPFCGGCTRARVSADGHFFTCLFATLGHDLRALLRGGLGDDDIARAVRAIWRVREDRYSEQRSEASAGMIKAEMSVLGG
jgi:cyclic pyranopterin phosphate synthase